MLDGVRYGRAWGLPDFLDGRIRGDTGGSLGVPPCRGAREMRWALRCDEPSISLRSLLCGFKTILPGHQSGGGFRVNPEYGRYLSMSDPLGMTAASKGVPVHCVTLGLFTVKVVQNVGWIRSGSVNF